MRALCLRGVRSVRVESVPKPVRPGPRDAIVRVSLSGISGSDLQLYQGHAPGRPRGDILGHEFCGEVVEVGDEVAAFRACDRVVGGLAGSDAEYVRVPLADLALHRIPDNVTNEQALFTSDALPTGMHAAELCNIRPGDTVAVWGAGPVGQCAMLSALQRGASRVFAIDRIPARLEMARRYASAEALHSDEVDVIEALREQTGSRGPDACIDALGHDDAPHARGLDGLYERVRRAFSQNSRASGLDQAVLACREGGVIAIVGPHGGQRSSLAVDAAMAKGLTLRMGQPQANVNRGPLLAAIARGDLDPSYLITHRFSLERAQHAFELLEAQSDECLQVLLSPN